MTAYPMRISIKIIRMGLVMLPSPPNTPALAASCHVPASFKDSIVLTATALKSDPRPVIPAVKLPCRETHSL